MFSRAAAAPPSGYWHTKCSVRTLGHGLGQAYRHRLLAEPLLSKLGRRPQGLERPSSARFASRSASLLPLSPLWPGVQRRMVGAPFGVRSSRERCRAVGVGWVILDVSGESRACWRVERNRWDGGSPGNECWYCWHSSRLSDTVDYYPCPQGTWSSLLGQIL